MAFIEKQAHEPKWRIQKSIHVYTTDFFFILTHIELYFVHFFARAHGCRGLNLEVGEKNWQAQGQVKTVKEDRAKLRHSCTTKGEKTETKWGKTFVYYSMDRYTQII